MADPVDNANRTCRNIAVLNKRGIHGYYFVCSECGLAIDTPFDIHFTEYRGSLRTFCVGPRYEFERCPRCGAIVREAVATGRDE